jgi:muconate cycloisomerase
MKLTEIDMYEVVVPAREDRVNSRDYGPALFDRGAKWIIQARTDAGLVGLAESPRDTSGDRQRAMLQMLAGLDLTTLCMQEPPVTDFSANDMFGHEHPQRPNRLTERSFIQYEDFAIHTLLLDLLGKKLDVPAYVLLGGAYRRRVAVDYWMGRMTPEDSARVCREAQAAGYRGVKCKCALEDDNVARAEAVRDACGPQFKLTFDPNQRFYRWGEAIGMLRRLAAVGNIGCVEDPFPRHQMDQLRMLREQGLFPVAMHLDYGPALLEAIRQDACDYMNIQGMPWQVRKAGDVCWLAGLPAWHGSGLDLGILEASCLHACAATKAITRPSDILGRMIREHNLITNAMPVENGCIAVPDGPGVGVELDRDALDRYTQRHVHFTL